MATVDPEPQLGRALPGRGVRGRPARRSGHAGRPPVPGATGRRRSELDGNPGVLRAELLSPGACLGEELRRRRRGARHPSGTPPGAGPCWVRPMEPGRGPGGGRGAPAAGRPAPRPWRGKSPTTPPSSRRRTSRPRRPVRRGLRRAAGQGAVGGRPQALQVQYLVEQPRQLRVVPQQRAPPPLFSGSSSAGASAEEEAAAAARLLPLDQRGAAGAVRPRRHGPARPCRPPRWLGGDVAEALRGAHPGRRAARPRAGGRPS